MELLLPDQDVELWEYAVLVTNSSYPLESMAQLYRDRADAENGFDELRTSGVEVALRPGHRTLPDQRSRRGADLQLVELYCRAAKPEARMEAVTSRALLWLLWPGTKHAGKTTLYLTPMHAARTTLMMLIANIRAALSHVRTAAEQLPAVDRWKTLLNYIVARIIPHRPRKRLEAGALLLGNCGF